MGQMEAVRPKTVKAYRVWLKGGDIETIVFAESAAKARWIAVKGAQEAGYHITWNGVSSRHVPDYDYWYHPRMLNKCYDSSDVINQYNHLKSL